MGKITSSSNLKYDVINPCEYPCEYVVEEPQQKWMENQRPEIKNHTGNLIDEIFRSLMPQIRTEIVVQIRTFGVTVLKSHIHLRSVAGKTDESVMCPTIVILMFVLEDWNACMFLCHLQNNLVYFIWSRNSWCMIYDCSVVYEGSPSALHTAGHKPSTSNNTRP